MPLDAVSDLVPTSPQPRAPGDVPEAPDDLFLYGRYGPGTSLDAMSWQPTIEPAPTDGDTYGRNNSAWIAVFDGGTY
jgi:hypothetical protein